MDEVSERIKQANEEKQRQVAALSDAELQHILQEPGRHSHTELEYARAELTRRNSEVAAPLEQAPDTGESRRSFVARYPYVVAWAMFLLLNLLLGFIPSGLIRVPLQIVIGYFIFQAVIDGSVLPHVTKPQTKTNLR